MRNLLMILMAGFLFLISVMNIRLTDKYKDLHRVAVNIGGNMKGCLDTVEKLEREVVVLKHILGED